MPNPATSPHLPTPTQEVVVQLILGNGPTPKSLGSTLEDFDPERADPELSSLLPLLARRHGSALPVKLRAQAEEIHQFIAFQNRLLLSRLAEVIRKLEAAGIATLALKGAALVAKFYRDPGLRFMRDGDLLIHPNQVDRALEILRADGWCWPWPRRLSPLILQTQHSIDLTHPDGFGLDLHWNPLNAPWHPGSVADFWDHSLPCDIQGASTRTLAPADQLFHICVHGVRYTDPPALRWIVDAAITLENCPDLDWDRLIRQSESREFTLWTAGALDYLRTRFALPVPREVVDRLEQHPVTDFFRADYEGLTLPRHASSSWNRGRLLWRRYRALAPDHGLLRRGLEFPFFLQHAMHAPAFPDMLRQLVKGRFQ